MTGYAHRLWITHRHISRITGGKATNGAFGATMGLTRQNIRRSPAAETEVGGMSADAEDAGSGPLADRPDWARRLRRPSGTGCALTVLMIWIGIGAALIDYRLVLASRVYCGAGDGTGDIFALNLEMLPRLLIGPAMAYGPYLLITFVGRSISPLWRFAPSRAFIRLIAVLAGAVAAGALIVFDFAQIGSLAGHLGDSGLCGPDNVPPWWPAWLPS